MYKPILFSICISLIISIWTFSMIYIPILFIRKHIPLKKVIHINYSDFFYFWLYSFILCYISSSFFNHGAFNKLPYYKMISKYFSIDGKDIPIDTAKNYFSDKQNDVGVKGTLVPPENKLFKIVSDTSKKVIKKSNKDL